MTTATAVRTGLTVNRKSLVTALQKLNRILVRRSSKPVLHHIRMEAADGKLWLAGTDLDISLAMHLPAAGRLPRCLAPCRDLLDRAKSGSAPDCELWLEEEGLMVNGGSVHHRLPTLPPEEYPLVPVQPEGHMLSLDAGQLRDQLKTALAGVARENTRYAINGVLLELKRGAHLVATDGRRMVVARLKQVRSQIKELAVILPARFCQQIVRLADKQDGTLQIFIKPNVNAKGEKQPSRITVVGNGWVLCSMEVDGHFPCWRDIVPQDGSKFLLDREAVLNTVREVSTACSDHNPAVNVRLEDGGTVISARNSDGSESRGQVPTQFQGGGDSLILTAFNPYFLIDAFRTLTGEQVIAEVRQNRRTADGKVAQTPAAFYRWDEPQVKWVIMPVSFQMEASRESLGSNYQPPADAAA